VVLRRSHRIDKLLDAKLVLEADQRTEFFPAFRQVFRALCLYNCKVVLVVKLSLLSNLMEDWVFAVLVAQRYGRLDDLLPLQLLKDAPVPLLVPRQILSVVLPHEVEHFRRGDVFVLLFHPFEQVDVKLELGVLRLRHFAEEVGTFRLDSHALDFWLGAEDRIQGVVGLRV